MKRKEKLPFFERLANRITCLAGSSGAIVISIVGVIVWAVSGPIFHYSENWQLVINTSTTIITFLMVFVIQKSQNKDSKAIQLKLNELLASITEADDAMVNIEDLEEEELDKLHSIYMNMAKRASQKRSAQE